MRVPMPSPKGTNRAQLFLNPHAAYDEALPADVGAGLLAFLTDKLSPEDLAEFCKMAGIDAGAAMDTEGEINERMPMAKTNEAAMDQRRAALALRVARTPGAEDFATRFPGAAKIKV